MILRLVYSKIENLMKERRTTSVARIIRDFKESRVGLTPEITQLRPILPGKFSIGINNQTILEFTGISEASGKKEGNTDRKSSDMRDRINDLQRKERSGRTRCSGNPNDKQHTETGCPSKKCRVRVVRAVNYRPKIKSKFKIETPNIRVPKKRPAA